MFPGTGSCLSLDFFLLALLSGGNGGAAGGSMIVPTGVTRIRIKPNAGLAGAGYEWLIYNHAYVYSILVGLIQNIGPVMGVLGCDYSPRAISITYITGPYILYIRPYYII